MTTATKTLPAPPPAGPAPGQVRLQLRSIPLLAGLDEEQMRRVCNDIRIRPYARRDVLLPRGGGGEGLLFVLAGRLQVVEAAEDGRTLGLRMLGPGDFYGEIGVIDDAPRSASVIALGDVLAAFLPAATALHLFAHSPGVARQMLGHLARTIRRDAELRAILGIGNTARRIYAYLALMQRQAAGEDGALAVVENLPTHQDIAGMINTSRETVTRALLTLAQQGIARKDGNRLLIMDPDTLNKLSQGT